MPVLVAHDRALFEQHGRRAFVKHRKVEVRDVQHFEARVVAPSHRAVDASSNGRLVHTGSVTHRQVSRLHWILAIPRLIILPPAPMPADQPGSARTSSGGRRSTPIPPGTG
jgi:hypothetical protein